MNELIVASVIASIVFVSLGVSSAAWRARVRRGDRRSVVLMCPGTGRPADIVALQDRQSARFTRIVRCSELPRGKQCRETCLRLANAARLHDSDPSV